MSASISAGTLDPQRLTLTPRQRDVVRLMAEGLRYAEIADRLSLSEFTIRNYAANIFQRLGVYSRAGAVGAAFRSGLVV